MSEAEESTEPKVIELESPTYDEVRAAIGCRLLQQAPDFGEYKGRACEVYVDEEGLCVQQPLVNLDATKAWREFLERKYPGQWDADMATIVGNAVIAYGGMK